jgi:tRNA (mo5U34)-methyltransferase
VVPVEEATELSREVESRQWYHTFELAPGLETPGWFDLREIAREIPLPPSLDGKRCLDVGTFDGFWAFEMERRGASEVIAVDLLDPWKFDWPAGSDPEVVAAIGRRKGEEGELGAGFEIARRVLESSVQRIEMSIYDLDPAELGRFDFVYVGSLLLHLRDPVGALERVCSVCSERVLVCDAINPTLSRLLPGVPVADLDAVGRPWWWKPNLAGLVRMVEAAGFELVAPPRRIRMRPGRGHPPPRFHARWLFNRRGREEMFRAWRGDPHAAILAAPITR